MQVFYTVSILTLTAMAIDRYKYIPATSRNEKSIRSYVKVSFLIWLFSVLVCSPLTYGRIETAVHGDGNFYCEVNRWSYHVTLLYYSVFTIINYILPLLILLFTQIKLSRILEHNHIPRVGLQHKNSAIDGLKTEHTHDERTSRLMTYIINSYNMDRGFQKDSEVDTRYDGENRMRTENDNRESKPVKREKNTKNAEPKSMNRKMNAGSRELKTDNRRLGKTFITEDTKLNNHRAIRDAVRVKRNQEAIRRLAVITGTFAVLWTPMAIMRFAYYSYKTIHPVFFLCAKGIAFASTSTNFFIYPKFRRSLNLLKACKKRRQDSVAGVEKIKNFT